MKVYVIATQYLDNLGAVSCTTDVYATKELAEKAFQDRIEEAREEAHQVMEDREIGEDLRDFKPFCDYQHFSIYKKGDCAEWDIEIELEEKEIKFV